MIQTLTKKSWKRLEKVLINFFKESVRGKKNIQKDHSVENFWKKTWAKSWKIFKQIFNTIRKVMNKKLWIS